jgi:hypothetical protein
MNGWNSGTWRRLAVVLTSAAAFAASLTQIACVVDNPLEPIVASVYLLIVGPFALMGEGVNLLVWPLVIAAWVLACFRQRLAALFAAPAILVLVTTPTYAAWLANPIIGFAWLLYLSDKRRAALISAVTALGLTLSFLRVDELLGPPTYAGVNIPDFEEVPIMSYGAGYWLWIASAGILVAGMSADTLLSRAMTSGRR